MDFEASHDREDASEVTECDSQMEFEDNQNIEKSSVEESVGSSNSQRTRHFIS